MFREQFRTTVIARRLAGRRRRESATSSADCDVLRLPEDETTPYDPNGTEPAISILVEHGQDTSVLKIAGELDRASCASVTRACVGGHARTVVVDLADLTFLDCGGYRAFVAARTELERQHRTLELVGAVGEPRRLLNLIQHFEGSGRSCWSSCEPPSADATTSSITPTTQHA